MSDQNPFAEKPAPKSDAVADNSALAWTTAGIAAVVAIVFLLLWSSSRADHRELDSLRTQFADTKTNLANALAENQKAQDKIAALQAQADNLQKERDFEASASKNLENEMRANLESKDVTISKLQGKLTVNILDRILFDSGEAILKPDGQAVMQRIGDLLAKHPELKIHVIGHTDNVPIRTGARSRFASNWELSTARALAAVHFLTEQAGVDAKRVGAVGYGEFRPIADNSTAEGRAKNRRIAITILPDELAGADTTPPATAANSTNSIVPPTSPQ